MGSSRLVGKPEHPQREPDSVNVHVLSEYVFCPRAAVLASESGEDWGDEEKELGPRLDMFVDYDDQRFDEALRAVWGKFRFWLTVAAPAGLLVLAVWRLKSPLNGLIVSLPLCYCGVKAWEIRFRSWLVICSTSSLATART